MFDSFYNALHAIHYPHPVHVTQVHMPVGLVVGAFTLAVFAYLLFKWPKLETYAPISATSLAIGARICIIVAFLFWFTTVASAFLDWEHFFSGALIFPIKVKMGLAGLLFILLVLAMVLGFRTREMPITLMSVYTLAFLTVVTLGFFGGVVAYGLRVVPAPPQYQAGQHVFSFNCVGCHPGGANNIKPMHAIWGSDHLKNFNDLEQWIRHPKDPMPPFPPSQIPDQQARELYQYLNASMGCVSMGCKESATKAQSSSE